MSFLPSRPRPRAAARVATVLLAAVLAVTSLGATAGPAAAVTASQLAAGATLPAAGR